MLREMLGIVLPDALPFGLNLLATLQLSEQKRRQKIGGQVARTEIDPGVFVDHAAKELAA
jgi:hypothetical protein